MKEGWNKRGRYWGMISPESFLPITVLPRTGWSRKILRLYMRKKTTED